MTKKKREFRNRICVCGYNRWKSKGKDSERYGDNYECRECGNIRFEERPSILTQDGHQLP